MLYCSTRGGNQRRRRSRGRGDAGGHADALQVGACHRERRRKAGAQFGDQRAVPGPVLRHRIEPPVHPAVERLVGDTEDGREVLGRPGQQVVVADAVGEVVAEPTERQPDQLDIAARPPFAR